MSVLQSWLLLIAVVAVVTLCVAILWAIIDTILFAIELRRVRRAARFRAKLALNASYGKRFQAHIDRRNSTGKDHSK